MFINLAMQFSGLHGESYGVQLLVHNDGEITVHVPIYDRPENRIVQLSSVVYAIVNPRGMSKCETSVGIADAMMAEVIRVCSPVKLFMMPTEHSKFIADLLDTKDLGTEILTSHHVPKDYVHEYWISVDEETYFELKKRLESSTPQILH